MPSSRQRRKSNMNTPLSYQSKPTPSPKSVIHSARSHKKSVKSKHNAKQTLTKKDRHRKSRRGKGGISTSGTSSSSSSSWSSYMSSLPLENTSAALKGTAALLGSAIVIGMVNNSIQKVRRSNRLSSTYRYNTEVTDYNDIKEHTIQEQVKLCREGASFERRARALVFGWDKDCVAPKKPPGKHNFIRVEKLTPRQRWKYELGMSKASILKYELVPRTFKSFANIRDKEHKVIGWLDDTIANLDAQEWKKQSFDLLLLPYFTNFLATKKEDPIYLKNYDEKIPSDLFRKYVEETGKFLEKTNNSDYLKAITTKKIGLLISAYAKQFNEDNKESMYIRENLRGLKP